jgi:hypothetical protein
MASASLSSDAPPMANIAAEHAAAAVAAIMAAVTGQL